MCFKIFASLQNLAKFKGFWHPTNWGWQIWGQKFHSFRSTLIDLFLELVWLAYLGTNGTKWNAFQNAKMGGGIAYLLDNHNIHTSTIQNQKEYPSSKNHWQEPNEHILFNVCSFTTFAIVSSNLQRWEQNMQTAVNCVLEFDTHAPAHRILFSCFSSRSAHNSFGH